MIREATPRDARAIVEIYNEYIERGVETFETEPLSEEEMRARVVAIAADYPYLVYEERGEVIGYCYAHAWKERAAYRYTLETTVYLAPRHRGRGIGRTLMERLIEACRARGYKALIACVTAENEASVALHARLGFRKVSHFERVGMKFGRWLDVVDYEMLL